jgi:AcrR family transcriptional regulator
VKSAAVLSTASSTAGTPRQGRAAVSRDGMAKTGTRAGRPGRPPRFEPETELALLFDATLTVLRRNDYTDVTIADILEEAGLSTRSFYRHFQSKDELLLTLVRHDAEAAAQRLRSRVHAAPTPAEALEAWIDEIVGFRLHRRKAERVALLGSPSARRAEGYEAELISAVQLLAAPLLEVLEAGTRDRSFPACEPHRDARMIRAIVFDLAGLHATSQAGPRAGVTKDILDFCLRALGANGPPTQPQQAPTGSSGHRSARRPSTR